MNIPKRKTKKESRTSLAGKRTALSYRRTLLSNERTYGAWIRTGLSTTVTGLGVVRLLGNTRNYVIVKPLGGILIITDAVFYLVSLYGFRENLDELDKEESLYKPKWIFVFLGWLLFLTSILSFILILGTE